MRCSKAQRLFDDLSEGRLPETQALELRRHLEECTDCRVAYQRAARLQQLLSLKRHEQPSPEYFDGFLTRFHDRLQAETRTRATWWERFNGPFGVEGWRTWSYAFAGGVGVFLVVSVLVSREVVPVGKFVAVDRLPATNQLPSHIEQVASLSSLHQPINVGGLAPVDAQASAPSYVLDRYTVTSAAYDVPDVHF